MSGAAHDRGEVGSEGAGVATATPSGVHAVIAEATELLHGAHGDLAAQAEGGGARSPALDAARDGTARAAALLGALLLLQRTGDDGDPRGPATGFGVEGPWLLTSEHRRLYYATPAACTLLHRTRAELAALVELGYGRRDDAEPVRPTPDRPTEVGFAIEMPDGHVREVVAVTYALPDGPIAERCYLSLLRATDG